MTLVSLGSWGDDRLGETLVLLHTVGQLHTAQLSATVLVLTPCRTSQDRADNHLHTEALTLQANSNHGVWSSQLPVRTDVGSSIQKLSGNLVQYLTLEGNTLGQHYVECRDAIGGHHDQQIVVDVVHIAYLAMIHALLSLELKVRLC